jgi:hypothetical protein
MERSLEEIRSWWERHRLLRHRFLLEGRGWIGDGTVVTVAPLAEGLDGWLQRLQHQKRTGVDALPLLRCLRGVAQALDFLHAHGRFLHDIKPRKLLRVCGRARFDDLISIDPPHDEAEPHLYGTPAYMAPEVISGRHPHAATDQYPLAITYYQMRTGKLPFTSAGTLQDTMTRRLTASPDLSAISGAEQGPLRRALARDPADRFPSCTALLRALWRAAARAGAPMDDGGEPSLSATADPAWLRWNDGTVVRLARAIDQSGRFEELPILADALEDAGCTDTVILDHCRQPGEHVRGCWVPDLLLGKE